MSEVISKSLTSVAQSAIIIFIGTIVNHFLGFLGRIIFVRFTTQGEYGIYSLAFTLMSVLITISTLGLFDGTTRYIAKFRAKDQSEYVHDTIISSIVIASISSVLISIIVYLGSDYIATNIYDLPGLSPVLRLLLFAIPLSVLISIFVAIFRGFGESKVKIYFNEILRPVTYLLFLAATIFLQLSFLNMVCVYVICILITFLAFSLYFVKKLPLKLKWKKLRINHITKELLVYSMPLLAVSLLLTIMSWTDTLMLGYFKTPEIVGMYNAAYTVASLLSVVINSVGFLYVPIISQLFSKNQIKELGVINATSTRWTFMFTLPLFFLFFIYPEFVLNFFYDSRYIEASIVLQILSIGFIMNSYFGMNYYTLMSIGQSKLLMNCTLISAALNILLNLLLIPSFGMIGASIASCLSFVVIEAYMTAKLYRLLNVHPFTNIYLKLSIVSIPLILLFYIVKSLLPPTVLTIVLSYPFFLLIYIASIIFTKSLDKEDLKVLIEVGKNSGINIPYGKILKLIGTKRVN